MHRSFTGFAGKLPSSCILVIKLRIAAVHKTENGSGWQVVADVHFKNSAINEKLFHSSKQALPSITPFFIYNSPPPRQFLSEKILLKKLSNGNA